MPLLKKVLVTLISTCVVIPLYLLLLKKELSVAAFSNGFFMIALIFLMVGAFIAIFISGFFDNFQKNMKDALRLRKNTEPKEYLKTSEFFGKKPVYWLAVGCSLLFLALILAFFTD